MATKINLDEYWENYLNKPVLEIYEETMQLFSQELPEEFWEEYAWEELVLEVFGHLEDAKEYQKVLDFTTLLKEKHPEAFDELHPYNEEFLIRYNLFHQNPEALQEPLKHFIDNAGKDVDYFVKVLHQLTYYQQEELVEQISAPAVYQVLENTEGEEEEGFGQELSGIRFYLEVRNQYRLYQQNGTYEWSPILERMQEYDFEVSPDYLMELAVGLKTPQPPATELQKLFSEDFSKCLLQLEGHFLKTMDNRGLSMVTAGVVWDMLKEFWLVYNLRKNKSGKLLFSLAPADYKSFVVSKGVINFMDMGADVAALLWGTQLVYDFLLQSSLISEKIHQGMLHTLQEEKGLFIADYQTEVWAFNFVHQWPKPESMHDAQWEMEEEILRRSYETKDRFKEPQQHLLKGLDPEDSLVGSIEKGYNKVVSKRKKLLSNMDQKLFSPTQSRKTTNQKPEPFVFSPEEYAQRPPKVGRNEPCPCGSGKKYKKCCGS